MKPIVPIVLALTLLSTGCRTAPADTPPAAPVVPAATMRVHARDWPSTFEAGGIVRARVTADIASRVMASVISVHGRPGDRVTRGTPLVTLDARELTAAERHADAMSDASAQQTRAAEGAVRAADAAVTLAETTYDRIRSLHDRRSATPQELDRATAALDAARAQRTSAQATLDATIASRTAATAAVDAAAIARSYTTLTAPFDGIITTRAIEPGDMATPGVRLLTLEDTTGARLEVTLDEARAARIAVSRTAHILLGNAPDAAWVDATVSEI
ncbi:MAG: efflux RND transporter periplasmic adaptor subunit, partial [Acidobacteriaceae bacterium]|nr:efflux RND transporter periplasmic adaptor subunit [Acidobacteriaceae bacterium]